MRLYKQYLQLYRDFEPARSCVHEVTLGEIAEALACTHRNAGLLLSKMRARELIGWFPQRGRGRKSGLRLLVPSEEIAKLILRDAVSRNALLSEIHDIRDEVESAGVQDQLYDLLFNQYGLQSEIRNQKRIDILRLPIRQPILTLDPLYMNVLSESFVASHLFDSLVRRESRSGTLLPHLAHNWESDESRLSWTFYLRKGVFFHNGKELDSEDVVYTLNRLLRSEHRTLYRSVFKKMNRVYALDRYTVCIELAEQSELFLPFLSTTRASIVPVELGYIGSSKFQAAPIGSGPYRLTTIDQEVCVLEVNTGYFRERAHLDRVEIWQVPGSEAEQDEVFRVIHNARLTVGTGQEWLQVDAAVSIGKFVTVNTNHEGPLSERAIRAWVLAQLCDWDTWDERSTSEQDKGTHTPILSRPLVLSTIVPYELDARRIADRLAAFGIQTDVRLYSPEDFKSDVRLASDLVLFSLIRDQDEQLRLYDLYRTMAEHLEPHAKTDIDTILRRITKQTDPLERDRLYRDIANRLSEESNMLILYEHRVQTAFHHSIRGISFNAQGWVDLRTLWFKS